MLKAQSNIKKINEARQADGIEEKVNKEDDNPHLLGEAKTAMKEVVEINANNSDTLTLEDRITMLNDDQRRIFDKMTFIKSNMKIMNASASLNHYKCLSVV